MRWLVVLDPIDGLIARTDTSLAIIKAAREKGIEVDTATIDRLYFDNGARVAAMDGRGVERSMGLEAYGLILMRKEPPYDLAFHYATQLLSLSETLVVNHPGALRNFNEKLITLPFAEFMPPTLVGSDPGVLIEFIERHGTAVIKALDSFQGKAVRKVTSADRATVLEFTGDGRQPVMVQPFLDSVFGGDKRVIMTGDRFLGAALRRPKQGYHANFANSEALRSELSEREQEIVNRVGPWLVRQGIYFSGLDFIGGYLTEINITCPTGIIQISDLEGRDLPAEVVDYFIVLVEQRERDHARPVD